MAKKAKTTKKTAKKVAKKASKTAAKKPAATKGKSAKAKSAKKSAKAPAKKAKKTAEKKPAAKKTTAAEKPSTKRRRAIKSPLSKKELRDFRERLLVKRRELLGDMSGMEAEAFRDNKGNGASDLSTMPVHMADIGTDNYEQEFTLGLIESERKLLRDIDQALERIENGTYGICLGTGEPIGTARLRAKPWARYTIDYARKLEQGLVRQPNSSYQNALDSIFGDNGDGDDDEDDDDVNAEDLEEEEDLV